MREHGQSTDYKAKCSCQKPLECKEKKVLKSAQVDIDSCAYRVNTVQTTGETRMHKCSGSFPPHPKNCQSPVSQHPECFGISSPPYFALWVSTHFLFSMVLAVFFTLLYIHIYICFYFSDIFI